MENYSPSPKEVAGRMLQDVLSPLKNRFVTQVYEGVRDGLLGQGIFYGVPSAIRKGNCEQTLNNMGEVGPLNAAITGLTFLGLGVAHISAYENFCRDGRPEVLLIPATTNVISGVYEWARSARRRVQEKLETSVGKEQ